MTRPLVGVTSWVEPARFGAWSVDCDLVEWAYIELLDELGARPLVLPAGTAAAPDLLWGLDGILLAGGGDVEPRVYGQGPHPCTDHVRPERDRSELAIAAFALEKGVPILGVCRGHQILNVAAGGDLVQDLGARGRAIHGHRAGRRPDVGSDLFGEHAVDIAPASRLSAVLGVSLTVKTGHHQAIDRLGDGWRAVGWAPDGVIEAIEWTDLPFAVGVQWHPEWSATPAVVRAFVEAAARRSCGSARAVVRKR